MKRFISILIIAAWQTMATAQVNTVVDSLFDTFDRMGVLTHRTQATNGNFVETRQEATVTRIDLDNIDYTVQTPYPADEQERQLVRSHSARLNKRDSVALDLIYDTLNRLSRTARQCHHYEHHADGRDSTIYTLELPVHHSPADTASRADTREVLYFTMYKNPYIPDRTQGTLTHLHITPRPAATPLCTIDTAAYGQMLSRIITPHQSVRRWNIHWHHSDSVFNKDRSAYIHCKGISFSDGSAMTHGDTRGTIYAIPASQPALARQLLEQVSQAAQSYVNQHPEQKYHFTRNISYKNTLTLLMDGKFKPEPPNTFNAYETYTYCDDDGYYILVLRTDGTLWVPAGFTKLSTCIDGQKTYLQ